MSGSTVQIVIAVIRRDKELLMVEQQGPSDLHAYWVMPGGRVEPGEVLTEALIREVYEEAGLQVEEIGPMAYCCEIDHPQQQSQVLTFAFEIVKWSGIPNSHDPDRLVKQVAWIPLEQALEHLKKIGWRGMREPPLAYLHSKYPSGTIWLYRGEWDNQELMTVIKGQ